MVTYNKKFNCIEFKNQGNYYLPIYHFQTNFNDGVNTGYYHLLKKSWFHLYKNETKNILKGLGFSIDFELAEQYRQNEINFFNEMFYNRKRGL
jgi:hypothetical protein